MRAYAPETVIAEKFHAMVILGHANSRMKDYYDVWTLSRIGDFTGDRLARAILATFMRRRAEIPVEPPDALSPAFANDTAKSLRWDAFVKELDSATGTLADVTREIGGFLMARATEARLLRDR